MIKLLFPIPRKITIAFSGGVDSVAVADFLSKNHEITCAFFHHRTVSSDRAHEFVTRFCADREIPLIVGHIDSPTDSKKSLEEHWRDERYVFLSTLGTVVTGHHLDDCIETYLMGALHGTPKLIPSTRNNVIRPFLTTSKTEFKSWCERKGLQWCQDYSNDDERFMRNYVRKNIVPHALQVNPGLAKTIAKMVRAQNI